MVLFHLDGWGACWFYPSRFPGDSSLSCTSLSGVNVPVAERVPKILPSPCIDVNCSHLACFLFFPSMLAFNMATFTHSLPPFWLSLSGPINKAEDKQNSTKSKFTQRICPFSLLQCLRHAPTDDICRDRKGDAGLFVGLDWWEENSEGWWIHELYICAVILLFLLHLCLFLYQLEALRQWSDLSWNCHVWSTVKWHAGIGPSATHQAPLLLNGVDKPCSSCKQVSAGLQTLLNVIKIE